MEHPQGIWGDCRQPGYDPPGGPWHLTAPAWCSARAAPPPQRDPRGVSAGSVPPVGWGRPRVVVWGSVSYEGAAVWWAWDGV